MAVQRRRHQYRRRLIPAIAAVSAAILILFVFISFLAPSPIENDHMFRTRINRGIDEGNENEDGGNEARVLRGSNSKGINQRDLWRTKNAGLYYGCSNASAKFAKAPVITQPNRYLAIATSGGLNQQRTGITDAVVAARILNATLVVPKLDPKSFWKDARDLQC